MLIEFGKRNFLMDFRDHRFRPAVPVGIAGIDFLVTFEKHIVHAPGVDGQAFDFRKFFKCFPDSHDHIGKELSDIPGQVSIHQFHAVGKAVDLFCLKRIVFQPAHNVPTGRCADIDCKIILQRKDLFSHSSSMPLFASGEITNFRI